MLQSKEAIIPEWQKTIVRERLDDYMKNPEHAVDFDLAMNEIENELLTSPNYNE